MSKKFPHLGLTSLIFSLISIGAVLFNLISLDGTGHQSDAIILLLGLFCIPLSFVFGLLAVIQKKQAGFGAAALALSTALSFFVIYLIMQIAAIGD